VAAAAAGTHLVNKRWLRLLCKVWEAQLADDEARVVWDASSEFDVSVLVSWTREFVVVGWFPRLISQGLAAAALVRARAGFARIRGEVVQGGAGSAGA
jgi:hypothetical protein